MDSQSRGRGFGARGGAAKGSRGGRGAVGGRGRASGSHLTKKAAQDEAKKPAAPPEKYVVMISNVENDLAKVHHDRLQAFLCLDSKREGSHSIHSSRKAKKLGDTEGGEKQAGSLCYFDLVCRSETRSAELSVYGPADADVSTIFAASTTVEKTAAGGKNKDPTASSEVQRDAEDNGEIEEALKGGASAANKRSDSHRPVFASLTDMAALLADKAYFTHPVGFHVNLPGKEAGAALDLSDMGKRILQSRKRQRHSHGDSAHKRVADTAKEGEEAEQRERKTAKTEAAEAEKRRNKMDDDAVVSKTDSEGDSGDDEAEVEEHCQAAVQTALKQYQHRQQELVTAVAVVSAGQWTARELRRQLKDLPGFLSTWRLYSRHYRVVFEDKESLFKAKQLLDQFHLEGNVRVALNLSDTMSRLNADYLAKEEAIGDAAES